MQVPPHVLTPAAAAAASTEPKRPRPSSCTVIAAGGRHLSAAAVVSRARPAEELVGVGGVADAIVTAATSQR